MAWIYVWDSLTTDDASISGVSINDEKWTRCKDEKANVTDPIYGKPYVFPVYSHTKSDGTVVRMAFQEQTPGVYLAFVESEAMAATVVPHPTRTAKFK